MDMLRFHKFTIGHAWVSDYGSPDEEQHFKNLIKLSPFHNVPSEVSQFPATLLLTGKPFTQSFSNKCIPINLMLFRAFTADHDNRVVPLHSLKYIAQLQYSLGTKLPETPLLIRVDCKSGHGAGKPITKTVTILFSVVLNIKLLLKSFLFV
jgi:prolyl oligopeptidase